VGPTFEGNHPRYADIYQSTPWIFLINLSEHTQLQDYLTPTLEVWNVFLINIKQIL